MNNIQTKLEQAQMLIAQCLAELPSDHKASRQQKIILPATKTSKPKQNNIAEIVNKIKNHTSSEKIDKNILDKKDMAGKILLPFYICYKFFPSELLTSGDIEKITDQLGVKIKTPNVSKAIKETLLRYLSTDLTRVKGKATPYKLNRKGVKYFETILNSKDE
jgi:hypothetical protein